MADECSRLCLTHYVGELSGVHEVFERGASTVRLSMIRTSNYQHHIDQQAHDRLNQLNQLTRALVSA